MGIENLQTEYGPFDATDIVHVLPLEETGTLQVNIKSMEARYEYAVDVFICAYKHSNRRVTCRNEKNKKLSKEEKKRKRAEEGTVAESKETEKNPAKASAVTGSAAAGAGGGGLSLKSSASLVKSATETIRSQESSSEVFKALFHKDDKTIKPADDLFMRIAGSRYTLR